MNVAYLYAMAQIDNNKVLLLWSCCPGSSATKNIGLASAHPWGYGGSFQCTGNLLTVPGPCII